MEYQEGIYFGMPEEEYHSIDYFSRSLCENFIVDDEEGWFHSSLNKERPKVEETKAMALGSAIHCMFLEPDKFSKKYVVKPTAEDFEDKTVLKTVDDIKEVLVNNSQKTSGKKSDLIERVKPFLNDSTILYDEIMDSFTESVFENNSTVLPKEEMNLILNLKKSLDIRPKTKSLLTGGYPEVVIIWKDKKTSLMCKCRIDYLTTTGIIDLKSFSVKNKKNLYKQICDTITYSRYNLQFFIYYMAVARIITQINKGKAKVYGYVDEVWLNIFLTNPNKDFFLMFMRTAAPYQIKALQMLRSEGKGGTDNAYYQEGKSIFEIVAAKYSRMLKSEHQDRDEFVDDKIEYLADEHVPNILYNGYHI